MGYTRYWHRTHQPITQGFVDEVKKIITRAERNGIAIRGWDGKGEPEITIHGVLFNGNAEFELDHETCRFDNEHFGFDFCKTARKPYDHVVKQVLTAAKRYGLVSKVSSDGKNNKTTDAEYLRR